MDQSSTIQKHNHLGFFLRKGIHITTAVFPLLYLNHLLTKNEALYIGCAWLTIWIVADILRYTNKVPTYLTGVESKVDSKHLVNGAILGAIVALILLLTQNHVNAAIPLLVLSLADPMAAIIGVYLGRHKIPNTEKSYEGSTIFFIVTLLILFWFLPLWLAVIASLIATLVELYMDRFIDDNISIPLTILFFMLIL